MRLAAFVMGLVAMGSAHATIITIDARDLAPGAPVNAAGARFSVFKNEGGIVALEPLLGGGSVIGGLFGGMYDAFPCVLDSSCVTEPFALLRVDFHSPTDYVGMRAVVSNFEDPGALWAFRADGSLISSCHFFGATAHGRPPQIGGVDYGSSGEPCGYVQMSGCDQWTCATFFNYISITSSSSEIAFVLFGGYAHNWNRHAADQISYSVSEPSSIVLLSVGLLGALASARRRRFGVGLR